ncbi:MAG: hypothetical protein LAO04_21615 [Acidobacteriia bacterium]|nr:hypothetical protein [Terriglobia bacterium]
MKTGTKFWLAVGTVAAMVLLCAVYLLRTDKPDATVIGAFLGVVTLVVGGYFTSNVVASGQGAGK